MTLKQYKENSKKSAFSVVVEKFWQKDTKKAAVIMKYIENHIRPIPKTTKQGSVCGIPCFQRKGWLLREAAKN